MMTVAQIEAADGGDEAEWEELDIRAIEAAKWTDAEIGKLLHEIQTRAEGKDDQGRATVTFGKLFVETDQIFDALSGILKTAKK